ncbi:MAG TPA: 50S ribosomal protein L25 [Polyangiaceae bacterium]|nr:50S ribosomal protein L25 [Polyangiaceae bacterium]
MQATTVIGTLNATHRAGTGKTVVRKIRMEGRIPAVCYGRGHDPILLSIDPRELLKALDPEKRANTVIALNVDGAGKQEKLTVMLRDWQRDPLKGNVVHADFVQVKMDQEVHATVPLVIVGKAEGVKLGGTLHQVFRTLEVACTPDKIPTKIDVNVEALGMGDALHVRDLSLGEGVRPLIDPGQTICTVTAPKAEKAAEAAPAEGAAAEGAAAEGAAPAEGAKAPAAEAKGAEKAPAKGEKK